jgi:glycosyltransferase involved in cell wall biosynthesis
MRIAFVNWNRRLEGGVETYLNTIITALHDAGHDVALCHEIDEPLSRTPIQLPKGASSWCVGGLGIQRAVAGLREWHPDVIYCHNLASIQLEQQILAVAPAVLFAHAYRGMCISGTKSFAVPTPHPCHRRFGWQCLVHFYPKRCGGLNPLTMASLYRSQANRLALIKKYKVMITNSEYLRGEYIRHGVPADRVITLPYCVLPLRPNTADAPSVIARRTLSRNEWRLAFVGRMDALKGGSTLLDVVPLLRARTDMPLRLTMAGDGPYRSDWEAAALKVQAKVRDVNIKFAGWLNDELLATLFDDSDLLVVPSLWPEPFGIVGVQAALQGLPAAAFDVGGIPTWLVEGFSGHLAPSDPPTKRGLTEAILRCLNRRDHYSDLCSGAVATARRFTVESHKRDLLKILETAAFGDRSYRLTSDSSLTATL